jgi:SAM-dependent methyltransferase
LTLAGRLGLGRLRRALTRWGRPVDLGALASADPASRVFGLDRGRPIDRFYIERFLAAHAELIRGRVIEVGDRSYTERFGASRVDASDVLHSIAGTPGATVIGDLTRPETLPEGGYDCFLCTQTLNFVFEPARALAGARRLLKPGGALLLTVGGISQVSRFDAERWGMFWGFTAQSLGRLLEPHFPGAHAISSYGNALAATAFLNGVAVEDLPKPELLEAADADYPVILAASATRAAGA